MTKLQTIFQNFRQAWCTLTRGNNLAQLWLRGDNDTDNGGAALTDALQQSVWIYGCVTAIAEHVAHTPFRFSIGRRGGEAILETGPLVQLFERPHSHLDRFLFWELLVSWLLLRGKAYIAATDRKGRVLPLLRWGETPSSPDILPAHLTILNPERITRVIQNHELLGYRYQAAHSDPLPSQEFLAEELLSVRLCHPHDFFGGLAPATVALLAAQTDYASAQFMKGLMINNADSGVIITTQEQISAEQREAMKAALRERKRKAGTPDRPLFLWGGARLEKPTLSAADLQFLENRKFNRQEICSIFRVPQEILGFTEDANRSVSESARLNFIENRIAPLCHRLESAVAPIIRAFQYSNTPSLQSPTPLYGWFDLEELAIMQKARRDRFAGARKAFDMGVPLNVCSRLFNLGLPGDLAHGDRSFLPSTLQEVALTPTLSPTEGEGTRARAALLSYADVEGARTAVQSLSPTGGEGRSEGVLADHTKALRSKLSRVFFEQRSRVLASVQRSTTPTLQTLPFDPDTEHRSLWQAVGLLLVEAFQAGAGSPSALAHLAPLAARAYLTTREQYFKGLVRDLHAEIESAKAEALSPADLAARVKKIFQRASDVLAPEIAAKEAALALQAGRSCSRPPTTCK